MAEYIEREALMKDFRTYMAERFDKEKCVSEENCKDCERKCLWHRVVAKAPAADVAPVVHGRWVTDFFTVWQCDKCHCPAPKFGYPKAEFERTAYCPNCGAKMDLEGGDGK